MGIIPLKQTYTIDTRGSLLGWCIVVCMEVWSSIYRVRDISLCDDYSIKLIAKDGREVKLENPIEIKEEVYGSKNITPIHEWFVRFARERLGITGDELVNDSYSADIPLDLDDLVELVDTINKVLKNLSLARSFYHILNGKVEGFGISTASRLVI